LKEVLLPLPLSVSPQFDKEKLFNWFLARNIREFYDMAAMRKFLPVAPLLVVSRIIRLLHGTEH
jgi:hypothetical protein